MPTMGTLENIAAQLSELNTNLIKMLIVSANNTEIATGAPTASKPAKPKPAKAVAATAPEPEPETTDTEEEEAEPAPVKKAAPRKAAAKTTPKKAAKAKAPDLTNMAIFKKTLFEAAESSKVEDVFPKLKAFLTAQGYTSSDKIELADREDFVTATREHFEAMVAAGTADDDDVDELDNL